MRLFKLPIIFVCELTGFRIEDKVAIPALILGNIPIVRASGISGELNIVLEVVLIMLLLSILFTVQVTWNSIVRGRNGGRWESICVRGAKPIMSLA